MIDWVARNKWYSNDAVLFEIVKNLRGREFCLLESKIKREDTKKAIPVRCIKAHALNYLRQNFDKFCFYERNYDCYVSVASFFDMPMFSYSPIQRKEQQNLFFGTQFDSRITSYDLFFDIDSELIDTPIGIMQKTRYEARLLTANNGNHKKAKAEFENQKQSGLVFKAIQETNVKEAHKNASELKKVLDTFKLDYSVNFSANRGFHFILPANKIWPVGITPLQQVELAKNIAKNLQKKIELIDTKIYTKDRIRKLEYSLCGEYVCLPLSDKEFSEFSLDYCYYKNVMKNIAVRNRGNLLRNQETNKEYFLNTYAIESEKEAKE